MTEHEDPRVSAGYQALGRENPPEALDAAILAASRRAVGAGPRRNRLRRWALPVSIAAVVVLTMSIVVRIQLERPDLETATPVPVTPQVLEDKATQRAVENEADAALAKRKERPAAKPKSEARERLGRGRQATPAPASPAPAAAPAPRFVQEPPAAPTPSPAESGAPSALGAASAPADRAAAQAPGAGRAASGAALEARAKASAEAAGKRDESPRAWLERIARLRREGQVKEADESLAAFRKRYPDYEIPKELREAVLGTAKTE